MIKCILENGFIGVEKDMKQEGKKIPKLISREEYYPDSANCPTVREVYKCFCKKGKIERHYIPGFDDEYFEIKCPVCRRRYHDIIDRNGDEWIVYPKQTK